MRAIVTGGAGFIGSHMADRLIAEGFDVTVIDDESTGRRENINPRARYIKGDIRDMATLEQAFDPVPDVVFHIAGKASTIKSFDDPYEDMTTNIMGTVNILQLCIKHRVPRLLYASSMTVYGEPTSLPIPESEPAKPISYYGITKFAAERYVHATAQRNDLDFEFNVTSFRMFNVYGPRQSLENPYQGVVAIFISCALKGKPITIFWDGKQSRDFVYIDDVVDAWMLALDNPEAYGQVFNIGYGKRHTIDQLADAVLGAVNKRREEYQIVYKEKRPGDQRHMEADIRKAREVLGWN
ncbi:MAG TPA: SDR family NAD(P)-dependent oxidoreductase, partial [Proteobacteria bacterium]|nr:SDR family NAD(P)-dependent oxidoreductase [Pseudomonadota bacterium]